ncbi:MAG: aryl-sulfate sulfotransferase [Bacteroidota bacterium]
MKSYFTILSILLLPYFGISQQTMGLFTNEESSYNGYTLFSPNTYNTTYLIDNCGEVVNFWASDAPVGLMAYLTEEGKLIRTGRIGGNFSGGGAGGKIEIFDWDGNLEWSWTYANIDVHAHHDIEIMPNGNILLTAWESRSEAEAIQNGRDPFNVNPTGLWPDHILEIEPVGTDQANIVWEWYVWDHLIQAFDATKDNFGNIADHPERIDINFELGNTGPDFNHTNSIDYNATYDQILLSVRSFHEIWVIDHSTTTAEAAGSTGGTYGKGGDLLYRYGNPGAYKRGDIVTDRKLFGQHDAQWIPDGFPGAGQIMVFNNGVGRQDGSYSSVDVLQPPINPDGSFIDPGSDPFGPSTLIESIQTNPTTAFFSPNLSGASRLPNGNTLACIGALGTLVEFDPTGQFVWEYINPINTLGPMTQGATAFANSVFKVVRYPVDYPAFTGRDLTPQGPLELNPLPSNCVINDPVTSIVEPELEMAYSLYPNPVTNTFRITGPDQRKPMQFICRNSQGQTVIEGSYNKEDPIRVSHLPKGLYFVHIIPLDGSRSNTLKFLKL